MSMRLALPLLTVAIASGAPAYAQEITGTWYGAIDDYTYGEPRRTLKITERDGNAVCTWDEQGKTVDHPAPCAVKGNEIELTTGGLSRVKLTKTAEGWRGSFTLKDGQPFTISMGRDPIVAVHKPITKHVKTCRGSVGYTGQYNGGRTAFWLELKETTIAVWYKLGAGFDAASAMPTSKDAMKILELNIALTTRGDTKSFANPFNTSKYTLTSNGTGYKVKVFTDNTVMDGEVSCQ